MPDIDIYDLLNKISVEDATITQLNSATGRTKIDRNTIEFWQGVLTVAHTMKQSRTFTGGLPLADKGGVSASAVADGAAVELSPSTGTEIWLVQGFVQNALAITQNGVAIPINAGGFLQYPIYVTKLTPLTFANATGGSLNAAIQYQVVSL